MGGVRFPESAFTSSLSFFIFIFIFVVEEHSPIQCYHSRHQQPKFDFTEAGETNGPDRVVVHKKRIPSLELPTRVPVSGGWTHLLRYTWNINAPLHGDMSRQHPIQGFSFLYTAVKMQCILRPVLRVTLLGNLVNLVNLV